MTASAGSIELERAVDSIQVGRRHRTELGDIDALAASIRAHGLLQPPTITPDGVLVCGARRIAAIRQLGWRKVNVWVRSGLSGTLGHLLAEQDDNVLHKPLTQVEAASLYRELKKVMAEDAQRREARTRFSSQYQPGPDGGANFAPPSEGALGKTREQAAAMIPGRASHTTLEKITYLQQIAEDPHHPELLRAQATKELAGIEDGGPVHPAYERIRAAVDTARAQRADELDEMAQTALARAKAAQAGKNKKTTSRPTDAQAEPDGVAQRWSVRAFIHTWTELAGWWTHYEVDELAQKLTTEQITAFLATAEGTKDFAKQLHTAHQARTSGNNTSEISHMVPNTKTSAPEHRHLRAL